MRGNPNQLTQKNETITSKPKWTHDMLETFCDICVRTIQKGLPPGTQLFWENVLNEFYRETNLDYDKAKLKNKWDSMKKDWKLFLELIGKETGLRWDTKKNTVDASDDWWAEKIKVKSIFKKFRNQWIPKSLLKKMNILFMDTVATGEHACASSIGVLIDEADELDSDVGNNTIQLEGSGDSEKEYQHLKTLTEQVNGECQEIPRNGHMNGQMKERKGKRVDRSSKQVKKGEKLKKIKQQSSDSTKLSEPIGSLIGTVESRGIIRVKITDLPGCSIAETYADLISLPEIEEGNDLWLFATELLESKTKREAFAAIKKPEAKLVWLKYHKAKANM